MAFVQLGRCERLEDIYIIPEPELNVDAIRCDPEALAETERLEKIFDDTKSMQTQHTQVYTNQMQNTPMVPIQNPMVPIIAVFISRPKSAE